MGKLCLCICVVLIFIILILGIIYGVYSKINTPEHNHKYTYQYQPVSNISVNKNGIACGQWNTNGANTQVAICWSVKTGLVLPAYRYTW